MPRVGIFDYEFTEDGRQQGKILFVVWAPDTAKIKAKMLYASSKVRTMLLARAHVRVRLCVC